MYLLWFAFAVLSVGACKREAVGGGVSTPLATPKGFLNGVSSKETAEQTQARLKHERETSHALDSLPRDGKWHEVK